MNSNVVVFDFSRQHTVALDLGDLWNSVEQIKNGLIFISKWESRFVLGPPCHCFVFTNTLPDPKLLLLSNDRFCYYRIGSESKKLYKYKMSLEETKLFGYDKYKYLHELKRLHSASANKKKQFGIKKKVRSQCLMLNMLVVIIFLLV